MAGVSGYYTDNAVKMVEKVSETVSDDLLHHN